MWKKHQWLTLACHFFVVTTFWHHLWSITEQMLGNMESILLNVRISETAMRGQNSCNWELQKEYLNQQFFFQFQKTKQFYSWLAPFFIHNYVSISIKLDTWGYSSTCISFIISLRLFAVLLLICSRWWPTVGFLIDCSTSFSRWLFISEMDRWDSDS